jgi:predicted 3-demethylubiquinone-9 3-methyltransferase (glyoxalase superfamily)
MFTGNAEAAMQFYISIFNGASITAIKRYGPNEPGKEGSIYQAKFCIDG